MRPRTILEKGKGLDLSRENMDPNSPRSLRLNVIRTGAIQPVMQRELHVVNTDVPVIVHAVRQHE